MPDYSKGKIYTIRCRTDDTLIYVGSTIQSLAKRLGSHKPHSKDKNKNNLLYSTINGDWNNWYIELYEMYPCSCIEEMHKREGEVIREIGTLNSQIAGRTKEEYDKDNKEATTKYKKTWYEKNKIRILQERKEKYKILKSS